MESKKQAVRDVEERLAKLGSEEGEIRSGLRGMRKERGELAGSLRDARNELADAQAKASEARNNAISAENESKALDARIRRLGEEEERRKALF